MNMNNTMTTDVREIKFRAWEETFKRMYSWDEITTMKQPIHDGCQIPFWFFTDMKSKYIKWQQYTGLKDKDINEIYEGDIVDGEFTEGFGAEQLTFQSRCLVEWDLENGKWIAQCLSSEGDRLEVFDLYDFEPLDYVIGNIHQNPELLQTENLHKYKGGEA
jgi:uncharacterized phage protein (TIGR01671 family)